MRIDWWTLALQAINVLILIWLLNRLLYRPVLALVDRRRADIAKQLDDAARARRDAEALRVRAAAIESALQADRQRLMTEAHTAATAQAAVELAKVAEQTLKLRAIAADDIARARDAAAQDVMDHASALAIEISRRLVGRLPSSIALAAFVEGLCAAVRDLPPQERAGIADTIELVTAVPLAADALADTQAAIELAFGRSLTLTPTVDPLLIAGLELRTPHALICNSWRADLDRIAKELNSDSQQPSAPHGLAPTGHDNRGADSARPVP
jgi:F-type H+-transporting ATPase subunit b